MILSLSKKLRDAGVLGINQRNIDYILKYNPRRFYPLVDDKYQTKQLALSHNIAVPELYCVVDSEHQIKNLSDQLSPYLDFVVKPAHGSGGDGILVIVGREGSEYRKSDGSLISIDDFNHHVINILGGLYSLGGVIDKALFEYRVDFDPIFSGITERGVPDIRVIVFLGYPVMAMVRLPTTLSQGKANLHQGAVGVGVDMMTGITQEGVIHNRFTEVHPDTGNTFSGISLPGWDALLQLAASCYDFTQMGYIGVDIVLDRTKGPLMLELNARPGLGIQIANRRGIHKLLSEIESKVDSKRTASERIEFVRQYYEHVNI